MSARPLVISHGGCGGHAPENTLAGVRLALGMGADAIEIDVHATADGVPVLMHDDTVDRTTDGQGEVSRLALAEVGELDAGCKWLSQAFQGERVPTLEETLRLTLGKALLVIEIKQREIESAVLEVVRRVGAIDWAMAWSFWPEVVARMRSLEPRLPCGLLTGPLNGSIVHQALSLGAQGVGVYYQSLGEDLVRLAHRKALWVYAWTVDRPGDVRRLAGAGVDGIVSNYPNVALSVLRGR